MDAETMKIGLLMEAAQAQQKLAEASLKRLKAQSHELAGLVRDELHRVFVEELAALGDHSRRAAEALRSVQRVANVRIALWSLGLTLLCSAIPLGLVCWIVPSQADIRALSTKHAELASQVAQLEARGGRIDLRTCGESRLCVRVDRQAPAYGDRSDYLVVKGY